MRGVAAIERNPNNWITDGGSWRFDAVMDEMQTLKMKEGQLVSPEPSLNTSASWMMLAPKISPINTVYSPSPPAAIRHSVMEQLTDKIFTPKPKDGMHCRKVVQWESI
jgi:hypothetical protein